MRLKIDIRGHSNTYTVVHRETSKQHSTKMKIRAYALDSRLTSLSFNRRSLSIAVFAFSFMLLSTPTEGADNERPAPDAVFMKVQFPDDCPKLLNGLTWAFEPSAVVAVSLAGAWTEVKLSEVTSITHVENTEDYLLTLADNKTATVKITRMPYNKVSAYLFGIPMRALITKRDSKPIWFHSMTPTTKPAEEPQIVSPPQSGSIPYVCGGGWHEQ